MKNHILLNPIWMILIGVGALVYVDISVAPMLWEQGKRNPALYAAVLTFIVFIVITAILSSIQKIGSIQVREEQSWYLPGIGAMLAGAFLSVGSFADCVKAFGNILGNNQETEAPIQVIQSSQMQMKAMEKIDEVFFDIAAIGGVVGGIVLVALGFLWILGKQGGHPAILWTMIFPCLWAVGRLVRYTISYTSTVRFPITFIMELTLVCNTCFLYLLTRQMVGFSKRRKWLLANVSTWTAIMGLSSTIALLVLPLVDAEYISDRIITIGFLDGCVAIFALCVSISLYSKQALSFAEHQQELLVEVPVMEQEDVPVVFPQNDFAVPQNAPNPIQEVETQPNTLEVPSSNSTDDQPL